MFPVYSYKSSLPYPSLHDVTNNITTVYIASLGIDENAFDRALSLIFLPFFFPLQSRFHFRQLVSTERLLMGDL